jgi:outer membrane protein
VTRAETDFAVAKQDLVIRVSTRYFNVLAAEDNLSSAVAREAIAPARAGAAPLRGGSDRDHRRSNRKPRSTTPRPDRRAAAVATAQGLREIVGEIVADLASPIDDLPLLTPDPANAEQWVQAALKQPGSCRAGSPPISRRTTSIFSAGRYPTLSLSAAYNDSTRTRS